MVKKLLGDFAKFLIFIPNCSWVFQSLFIWGTGYYCNPLVITTPIIPPYTGIARSTMAELQIKLSSGW